MGKKVTICGVDTSSLPKLTQKQALQYLERIKQGDEEARTYFINCNLRLVLSVAQRYAYRYSCADDLFQIGCVGLIKAVENFDLSHGVRFSTYAVPLIAGEIRRFVRESNSMRVSRSIRDVAYQALQARERLDADGKPSTIDDIAAEMKLPVFNVLYCLDAISDPVSLSENVFADEEDCFTLEEKIADDKTCEQAWAERISLFEAMEELDEKERSILEKRFFQGKTQNEVSGEIGLSQAQVSRLENNAVKHLRESMSAERV